jgi:hypothetical protein
MKLLLSTLSLGAFAWAFKQTVEWMDAANQVVQQAMLP